MEYKDYYATLGVPRTASKPEIKKAFRKLARQHHPDVNKGDSVAERRFKDVSEANEVLSDPEKRKLYDEMGADWAAYQRAGFPAGGRGSGQGGGSGADPFAGFRGFGGAAGGPGGVRFEFRGDPGDQEGFSDFFRTFFSGGKAGTGAAAGQSATAASRGGTATGTRMRTGSLEDLLSGFGSGEVDPASSRRRAAPRNDAEAAVEISLEDAYHGADLRVEVEGRRLDVKIPRGVDTGRRIRLSGKAGSGPDAGDLYLRIKVRPHPIFTRVGHDLRRELRLTLGEALLGADVPVGTLKGRVLLTIPVGTQNDRTFRLKGQGMPHLRPAPGAPAAGDLLVKVKVILPTRLDEEATEAAHHFIELAKQPDPRD